MRAILTVAAVALVCAGCRNVRYTAIGPAGDTLTVYVADSSDLADEVVWKVLQKARVGAKAVIVVEKLEP